MNKFVLPFSITTLALMLSACGGGSNNIHEDPLRKPDGENAIGCKVSTTNTTCFEFMMEYPIAGVQYTCSSDQTNTFGTYLNGNIVSGGCDKTDTVVFFINATDKLRIELGRVKLSDLGTLSAASNPVHLTLLDMAKGLTGQAAQSLNANDATVKVALSLVKIFQAIGSQRAKTNVVGNIQPIELEGDNIKGLDQITAKVDLAELQDGTYAAILKPWIDVNEISDAQALAVLKQASNMTMGALYQADVPIETLTTRGLSGYAGTGTTQKALIGSFFLLSDRQGFTQGYGIQWRGIPTTTSTTISAALDLMRSTDPVMMNAAVQTDWINPITKRLATGEKFKFVTTQNDSLFLNKGRLLNDYGVAGSETFYKAITQQDTVVQDDLSSWSQNSGSDQYSGVADFVKAAPISYLDRRTFRSVKNVEIGTPYDFPLYATLNFKFDTSDELKDGVELGIVIDEYGDIRTDVKDWTQSQNLSGQCGVADASLAEPKDDFGVQQYRIGTVAATSYIRSNSDQAITPRIILSGSQFGVLNGVLLGVNTSALAGTGALLGSSTGIKINLYSLINNSGDINISGIGTTENPSPAAQWANFYNAYKLVYIAARKSADTNYQPTSEEAKQIKRVSGTVTITLADCYKKGQTRTQ